MIYLFVAVSKHPQTSQAVGYLPGTITRLVINYPGNKPQAMQAAHSCLTHGVTYHCIQVPPNAEEAMVLCVERMPPAPVQSTQAVQGAQPGTQPTAQPNQVFAPEPRDTSSGFEKLGSDAMGTGGDTMFGDAADGTWTDLVNGGIGAVERARPT